MMGDSVVVLVPWRRPPYRLTQNIRFSVMESRHIDPDTSYEAAVSLDHDLKDKHLSVLRWLRSNGPSTDDEMALALSGSADMRLEAARRVVRTVREHHGLIIPAMKDGHRIIKVNESGRRAQAWIAAGSKVQMPVQQKLFKE